MKYTLVFLSVVIAACLGVYGLFWVVAENDKFWQSCRDHGGHQEQTGWMPQTQFIYDGKGRIIGSFQTEIPIYSCIGMKE